MAHKPLPADISHNRPSGRGPAAREHVQARAREPAVVADRAPLLAKQADYAQARRELTGESDLDRQDAILDALPEEKRWDPVPGSTGHQVPESPSEDEDAEGRSQTEQLVDEGAIAAERDRLREDTLANEGLQPGQ